MDYRAHDEVSSRLTVFEEMPRHSGHGLVANKKARPQQGQRDGPRKNRRTGESPAAALKERMPMPLERLLFSADFAIDRLSRAKGDPAAVATGPDGSRVRSSAFEAIPGLRHSSLWKQVPKRSLGLFSVCHFVALTGERVAFFLASDAASPCPAPCVFAVPVRTLARLSDRSTSQMICCRSWLSSCSISQSALDRRVNVDPEVALRLCPLGLAAINLDPHRQPFD
jgi:hypothetical protein